LKVGYQGEAGANSDEAALKVFPDAETVGFDTFSLVFDALAQGRVNTAILPVENSLAGVVQEVNDLLWECNGLRIGGEYIHPVRHCLLGFPGETITRAISHPQALAQCRRYLEVHNIRAIPFHDTAGAARHLAETRQPGLAAIAAAGAARRYSLQILAEAIQDDPSNRTRFVVVEKGKPQRPAAMSPGSKASLAFIAAHRPGSLVSALQTFADNGINLTRLDSRPLRDQPFKYLFYVDFEIDDPSKAEEALLAIEADAAEVKLFGSYPAPGR
jgi:prephenate dehydratase